VYWIERGGKKYLYESRKVGKRVRKVYLGCGPMAKALMQNSEAAVSAKVARAAEQKREADMVEDVDRMTSELHVGLDLLVTACLFAAGFHQHDRGAWRQKK